MVRHKYHGMAGAIQFIGPWCNGRFCFFSPAFFL